MFRLIFIGHWGACLIAITALQLRTVAFCQPRPQGDLLPERSVTPRHGGKAMTRRIRVLGYTRFGVTLAFAG